MEARYYASTQGRFTSTDPLYFQMMMAIDPQRFNLYSYARNNPLKFIDPSGEKLYLRGNEDWLRANVLYEIVGGQENFDRYFEITDGQVVARSGVDTSGANAGVQELLGLVNATENYLYFSGTDGTAAADLFKETLDKKGKLNDHGKDLSNQFTCGGSYIAGCGTLVGTAGRAAQQPAALANGDPVFAVIAYNTSAIQTQNNISLKYLDPNEPGLYMPVEAAAQMEGVGQTVQPVSLFIHESTENREFSRIGAKEANYPQAHVHAMHREAALRKELHITGGFAGGALTTTIPKGKE